MRTILIALLMALATQAQSDKSRTTLFDKSFTAKGENFYINLSDNAINACWTNLKESREYIEEKLRSKGATVVEKGDDTTYSLNLSVLGLRNGQLCSGYIQVDIVDLQYYANGRWAVVQAYGYLITNVSKMNDTVIETIQILFEEVN